MRKFYCLLLAAVLAAPALASAQSFKNVAIVDTDCSKKVAADPDSHTRDCALACAKSGFGIVTADNKYIRFDDNGNKQVLAELKSSDKKDHLRVDVSGKVVGDTLKVSSVKLL